MKALNPEQQVQVNTAKQKNLKRRRRRKKKRGREKQHHICLSLLSLLSNGGITSDVRVSLFSSVQKESRFLKNDFWAIGIKALRELGHHQRGRKRERDESQSQKKKKREREDNCCLSDWSKMKFPSNHIKNKENRQLISRQHERRKAKQAIKDHHRMFYGKLWIKISL